MLKKPQLLKKPQPLKKPELLKKHQLLLKSMLVMNFVQTMFMPVQRFLSLLVKHLLDVINVECFFYQALTWMDKTLWIMILAKNTSEC